MNIVFTTGSSNGTSLDRHALRAGDDSQVWRGLLKHAEVGKGGKRNVCPRLGSDRLQGERTPRLLYLRQPTNAR